MKGKYVFYFSLIIYLTSLCLPVWNAGANKPILGGEALMIGWLAVIIFDPRWFCNLIVIFSAICIYKYNERYSNWCYFLAIAGSTAIFGPFHDAGSTGTFGLGEGKGLAWGGYLWIASLWLFAISASMRKDEIDLPKISNAEDEPTGW